MKRRIKCILSAVICLSFIVAANPGTIGEFSLHNQNKIAILETDEIEQYNSENRYSIFTIDDSDIELSLLQEDKIIWFVQVPPQGPDPPQPPEEKIIWFVQVPPQGPDPPQPPEEKIIWFIQITEPGPDGIEGPVDKISPCKWYRVIETEPYQPEFVPPPCSWWHIFYPEEHYCISFHVDQSQVTEWQGYLLRDFHIDQVLPEPIVFDPPVELVSVEWIPDLEPIDKIEPCKWYRVIDTEPKQPGFVPPPCSWWHIFYPDSLECILFHVDKNSDQMFHIDKVLPERRQGPVDPSVDIAKANWTAPIEKIDKIEPCKWYRVIDTEPYQPGYVPEVCSWWHIFYPQQLYCTTFHVDKTWDQMFHIDKVLPEPIPIVDPPVDLAKAEPSELPQPNLDCDGSLSWRDVKPGDTVTDSFTVSNTGDSGSELDWKVESYPAWGTWTFTPSSGDNLKPEDGAVTVHVSVIAPDEKEQTFTGEVRLVNEEDSSDYCPIPVSLTTPKNRILMARFFEQFILRLLDIFPWFAGLINT